MAGKTNTKQICVFKTQKALLEFMDDTRYEKEGMAWPHTPMSRIRINAKDYSKGIGDLAVDSFYNLSPDEFFRLANAVQKAKALTINDYNRCTAHLNRLMELKNHPSSQTPVSSAFDEVMSIAKQFQCSKNELFSEAGEKLMAALQARSIIQTASGKDGTTLLDKMIADATAELEEVKTSRDLYADIKILNYEKYINPENDKERRVTSIKLAYNPKMNYPYAFTIANGWGVPQITSLKGVMIKEGSVRFTQTVYLCMDEKSLLPMLKRVEIFIKAMTVHGLDKYFETVTNPILFYEMNEQEN